MINSRKLEDLDADTEAKARQLLDECAKQGIKLIITSTFRDKACQDDIYSQGRTKPGFKVTNVRGGSSLHQYRVAFDIAPLDENGKLDWKNTNAFKKIGEIGQSIGLEWGGSWKGFVDMPHFQNTKGRTLADFKRLYPNGEAPPRQRRQSDLVLEQAYQAPKELPVISLDVTPVMIKVPPVNAKLQFPNPQVETVKPKSVIEILAGFFRRKND